MPIVPHSNQYIFRMNSPQQLVVSCDLNGYLVCKMPKDKVEVEWKIKTKWGKYTLLRDFHSRTEKYRPWERAKNTLESTPKEGQHDKQRQAIHKTLQITRHQPTQVCISPQVMVEAILLGYSQIPMIQVIVMQKL